MNLDLGRLQPHSEQARLQLSRDCLDFTSSLRLPFPPLLDPPDPLSVGKPSSCCLPQATIPEPFQTCICTQLLKSHVAVGLLIMGASTALVGINIYVASSLACELSDGRGRAFHPAALVTARAPPASWVLSNTGAKRRGTKLLPSAWVSSPLTTFLQFSPQSFKAALLSPA